jgi:hypothetical protein
MKGRKIFAKEKHNFPFIKSDKSGNLSSLRHFIHDTLMFTRGVLAI